MKSVGIIVVLFLKLTVIGAVAFAAGKGEHMCIDTRDKTLPMPIDFSSVTTLDELEVCVAQAANSALDYQVVSNWLSRSGFKVAQVSEIGSNVMRSNYAFDGRGFSINAILVASEIPIKLNIIDRFLVHSLSLVVVTDEDGKVLEVQATLTRK